MTIKYFYHGLLGRISKQLFPWSAEKNYLGKVPYGRLPAGLFLMYLCLSCQERVKPRIVPLTAKSHQFLRIFLNWIFVPFTHGEIISSACWFTSYHQYGGYEWSFNQSWLSWQYELSVSCCWILFASREVKIENSLCIMILLSKLIGCNCVLGHLKNIFQFPLQFLWSMDYCLKPSVA